MTDTFLSIENKQLLWQLLVESNAFSNIPNEHFERVKNLFEATLKEINGSNINLTDKNKTVIIHIMKKLPFLKNQSFVKPLEEVNIKIKEDFKNKQEEFINLVNHKPPSKPKFTDEMVGEDTPLDPTNMNNMLNQMMALREKELDQIQPSSPKNILNEETNKSLHSKKVSFETDNFISKLKRVEFKEPEFERLSSKAEIELNIDEDKKDIFITNLKSCISNQENILIQLKSLLNLIT